jgi:hypothetical protein
MAVPFYSRGIFFKRSNSSNVAEQKSGVCNKGGIAKVTTYYYMNI